MKIIKIVIDNKLPKCCEECIFLNTSKLFEHEYCPVIDEYLNVYGDCEDKRHKNCKLEVVIKNK